MYFPRNMSNQSFTKSKATDSEWCFSQTIFWNLLYWNFAIPATLAVIFLIQDNPSASALNFDANFQLFAMFFRARHMDEHTKLYRIGVFSTNFKIIFTTTTRQSAWKTCCFFSRGNLKIFKRSLIGCSNVHLMSMKKVLFVVESLFI